MDTDNRETEPVAEASPDLDLNGAGDKIASLLTPQEESQEAEATSDETPAEPVEAAEESTEVEQPTLAEVEYEGKKYQLPPELKDAFLRQADYTRKTQEAAELRKAAEESWQQGQQMAKLATAVGPLMGQYQALTQRYQQYQTPEMQQRWAQLQQSDPLTYFAERDEQRKVEQALMQVHGQLQAATVEMQSAEAKRIANLTQEGAKVLASRITDWGPDKAKALTQFGTDAYGFTPQELQNVVDPRMVLVLHDAHLYRQLQAKQPQVANKVPKAPPKVVKSNPAPEPQDGPRMNQSAMQRLKRGGHIDDAAAAIASLL